MAQGQGLLSEKLPYQAPLPFSNLTFLCHPTRVRNPFRLNPSILSHLSARVSLSAFGNHSSPSSSTPLGRPVPSINAAAPTGISPIDSRDMMRHNCMIDPSNDALFSNRPKHANVGGLPVLEPPRHTIASYRVHLIFSTSFRLPWCTVFPLAPSETLSGRFPCDPSERSTLSLTQRPRFPREGLFL